jgi:hypothetical protein
MPYRAEVTGTVVMSARLGRRTFLLAGSTGAAALLLPSWLSSPSSASAQGNEKSGLTRVLVRRPDGSVDASTLVVTGDGEFAATDAKGERVGTWSARTRVTVGREGDTFWLHDGDKEKKVAGLAGPLKFNGTGDGAPLRNQATSGPEPTSRPHRRGGSRSSTSSGSRSTCTAW